MFAAPNTQVPPREKFFRKVGHQVAGYALYWVIEVDVRCVYLAG